MNTMANKTINANEQAEMRTLSEAELDAVGGGSQSGDPRQNNFYNSHSFRADYALYPHTEMA
jgi:hypothetical protein